MGGPTDLGQHRPWGNGLLDVGGGADWSRIWVPTTVIWGNLQP